MWQLLECSHLFCSGNAVAGAISFLPLVSTTAAVQFCNHYPEKTSGSGIYLPVHKS